jgi:selenophosphate synthase
MPRAVSPKPASIGSPKALSALNLEQVQHTFVSAPAAPRLAVQIESRVTTSKVSCAEDSLMVDSLTPDLDDIQAPA